MNELGLKESQLDKLRPADTLLGSWYVNLFTVDRRKAYIFVNEKTLLSFILYGVKKSNNKKLPEMFMFGLEQLLNFEKFPENAIEKIFKGYDVVSYIKTDSKKILGNMNDLVSLYNHHIYYEWGLRNCNLTEIIMKINRTPQKNLGWSNSIEMVGNLSGVSVENTI